MPKILKCNAALVFILSCLFYWSFMYAKHDPVLSRVIPFGEDPYDAVGSFGVIVGMLIALLSLVRAFRPYRQDPSETHRIYLIRSQEAVILIVFITLASDVVAMARHSSMWVGRPPQNGLVALVGVMATATTAVQLVISSSREKVSKPFRDWLPAVSAGLLALVILAAYPERLVHGTATHLFTVIVGAVVLFAPMPPLLKTLVPYEPDELPLEKKSSRGRAVTVAQQWVIAVILGASIGACTFVSEVAEGESAVPIHRLVFVASAFIGLGLAGIIIAYALLRKPLGIGA